MLMSNRSVGSPLRQMMRVFLVFGTLSAISSSISTLSFSDMTTMRGRLRLSLAMTSSEMTSKIEGDQLKMIV